MTTTIYVDTDVERRGIGNDEVSDMHMVEASGVVVRMDLIVVEDGQATASILIPTTSLSTTKY